MTSKIFLKMEQMNQFLWLTAQAAVNGSKQMKFSWYFGFCNHSSINDKINHTRLDTSKIQTNESDISQFSMGCLVYKKATNWWLNFGVYA